MFDWNIGNSKSFTNFFPILSGKCVWFGSNDKQKDEQRHSAWAFCKKKRNNGVFEGPNNEKWR